MAKGSIGPIDKGALHRRLGIAPGKKIPRGMIRADLRRAEKAHDVRDEKQDLFALNMGRRARG